MPRLATHLKSLAVAAALAAALPGAASAAPKHDGTFTPSGQPARSPPARTARRGSLRRRTNKEFGRIAADGTITEFETPGQAGAGHRPALTDRGPRTPALAGHQRRRDQGRPGGSERRHRHPSGGKIGGSPLDMATDARRQRVGDRHQRRGQGQHRRRSHLRRRPPRRQRPRDRAGRGRPHVVGRLRRQRPSRPPPPARCRRPPRSSTPDRGTPGHRRRSRHPDGLRRAEQPAGPIGPAGGAQFTTDTGGDCGLRDRVRPGRRLLGAALPQGQRRPPDAGRRLHHADLAAGRLGPAPHRRGRRQHPVGDAGAQQADRPHQRRDPAAGRPPGGTTPAAKDTVKPRLAKLKINVAKRRFTVRLSEAASLRVTIEKRTAGKRKGKKCLAPQEGPHGQEVRALREGALLPQGGQGR